MLSRFIISCSVAVLMPTMAAAQGMTVLNPDGPYTQAATGMVFPESVGELKRVSIIQYKPDGTDESAGYNRAVPMQDRAGYGRRLQFAGTPPLAKMGKFESIYSFRLTLPSPSTSAREIHIAWAVLPVSQVMATSLGRSPAG